MKNYLKSLVLPLLAIAFAANTRDFDLSTKEWFFAAITILVYPIIRNWLRSKVLSQEYLDKKK